MNAPRRMAGAPEYRSASLTTERKVRASVSRTPSRPRARKLRTYDIDSQPMPRF